MAEAECIVAFYAITEGVKWSPLYVTFDSVKQFELFMDRLTSRKPLSVNARDLHAARREEP